MTAIDSMKAASSSLLFGNQGLYKTQNAQTSGDAKSSVITSSNSQASATAGLGANTAINPTPFVSPKSSESSKVNAAGLNTSFLSSKLFSQKTVGTNDNIGVGTTQFIAGQAGKDAGFGRTLCIA